MVTNKNVWYEAGNEADIPLVAAVPMAPSCEPGNEEQNGIPVIVVSNGVPPIVEAERATTLKPPDPRQDDEKEEEVNEKGEEPRRSCQHATSRRKCRSCRQEWKEVKRHLKREFKSMKKDAKKEWKDMKRASKTEAKTMKKDLKQEHRELKHSLRQDWRDWGGICQRSERSFEERHQGRETISQS